MKIGLIVDKPLVYGGVRLAAGDYFEAARGHARVFVAIKKAHEGVPNASRRTPSEQKEPETPSISTRALAAESEPNTAPAAKRTYRRRDLRAES